MPEWSYRVDAAHAGRRVDRIVRRGRPDLPYGLIQRLFREKQILVNDGPARADHRLREGDTVRIRASARIETVPPSASVPLEVRHEDEHLIVVAKPAGLAVHPGKKQRTRTLLSGLLERYGTELRRLGEDRSHGLVHRLDLGTSGVLLVARTVAAHESLLEQFRTRQVTKEYRALVAGDVPRPADTIQLPLERVERGGRTRVRVNLRGGGMRAQTDYRRIAAFVGAAYPATAYLAVEPKTGRTHQIRVHLATVGAPVCGDPLYGNSAANTRVKRELALDRMFLHAARLTIRHPGTGVAVTYACPLPDALTSVLKRLGHPGALDAED